MAVFISVLIVAVVAGSIIAGILKVSNHYNQKRASALENVAESLKMSFKAKDEKDIFRYSLAHLALMDKGRKSSRKALNIFTGTENGLAINMFDYNYAEGTSSDVAHYKQTVAVFKSESFNLPVFSMGPENFLHRIGAKLGMQDIDFEDYPQFSKQYLLEGENEAAIRSFFTPSILDFFTQNKDWNVEGHGQYLVLYKSCVKLEPEEMEPFMKETLSMATLFQSIS